MPAMVVCSHPQPAASEALQDFLRRRLGLSSNALNLGLRQAELEQAPLPIVLWSFGLLNLDQLQQVAAVNTDLNMNHVANDVHYQLVYKDDTDYYSDYDLDHLSDLCDLSVLNILNVLYVLSGPIDGLI